MADRDWNKELAQIDRIIESTPVVEEAPPGRGGGASPASVPERSGPATRAPGPAMPPARGERSPVDAGVAPARPPSRWARFGLATLALTAVATAVGTVIWPFGWRCGPELALYLGAVAGTGMLGLATAALSWRHRAARTHMLGLLVVLWSLALVAWQVLPRTGHALPTLDRPAIWSCA